MFANAKPPPQKNNKTQKTADAPASDYKQL